MKYCMGITCTCLAHNIVNEIHEMSELFDKQVNVQKESLKKNFQDTHRLSQAHKIVQ